jgi:hypothetical protein
MSPLREFSLMPFWFWNDALSEAEIVRQIADFEAHGVHGFVIHPRVGLPRELGWMSEGLLGFMRAAIDEAARRGMKVILYDEGMYPSGSSSGQVVAENPAFACRGLACLNLESDAGFELKDGENLVARLPRMGGGDAVVIDRKVDSFIRGLHYIGEGPAEDEPAMADILNPLAVQTFMRLVYDRFADAFGEHFCSTILGIFTDEPNALGRLREKEVWPGTTGILQKVNALLGYDFTPHLPALWFEDEPDFKHYRGEYRRAVQRVLEQTWYAPLSEWCRSHGIALCGHPAEGCEIGAQRFFDIPGQDLVWRFVEPGKPSALEGGESTQAKSASSAMIHYGRRRNSNEFCGAYGHQTSFEEMKWLADWCLVRGANLLMPHAFYYSVRGPRRDERPPQVGPNSPWWDRFKPFADHCARLCWVNTDSRHVCRIAILADPDECPWQAAKICLQHQRDFNYLETRLLLELAEVSARGISIAGMNYQLLIIDHRCGESEEIMAKLQPMIAAGRVVLFESQNAAEVVGLIDRWCEVDIRVSPHCADLRYRHVVKDGGDYYLFFNEGSLELAATIKLAKPFDGMWIDTATGAVAESTAPVKIQLKAYEMKLLRSEPGRAGPRARDRGDTPRL